MGILHDYVIKIGNRKVKDNMTEDEAERMKRRLDGVFVNVNVEKEESK